MDYVNTKSKLQRELLFFMVSGVLATLTDFAVYSLLHRHWPYSVAKACSFLAGSIVAYLMNKFVTFGKKQYSHREILRFALLYTSTLIVNVGTNSFVLWMIGRFFSDYWLQFNRESIILAFLVATGLSTVLNFCGQKFWVFRH